MIKRLTIQLFLIFFITTGLYAQRDSEYAFHLSNIPVDGILLDKGWRFHSGDNIDWAKPNIDDKKWQSIDPTKDVYDLPQLKEPGIGWFRLHLKVDSTILKESLVLMIEQTGASEIYLNGNNIYSFGSVSANQDAIKTYDPKNTPVFLKFNNQPFQILAVRYAYKKNMPYFMFAGRPNHCFAITINRTNQAIKRVSGVLPFYLPDAIRIGLFFILAILHFALYLFYPKKKSNLFFSLFSAAALVTAILYIAGYTTHDTVLKMYLLWVTVILFNVYHLLFLKALYMIVQDKSKIIYRIMLFCFIISIPFYFWPYHSGWVAGFILLPNAILIECARISFVAMKRKQRGAIILTVGAITFLTFYLSFYVAGYIVPSRYLTDIFYHLTYNIGIISLPVATSIFLSIEFASTNHSLGTQLAEVQKLSAQAIMQEQEKQQLLANQNQMLEEQVTERTTELTQQKTELQKVLDDLRSTQAQLIQSEKEKISAQYEKEVHELEAKALRAQMNPHFIFNCMNSIKALIQKDENEKATAYLTTFSKLIRTVFQNSDKREITLYDEIETCRLYIQLEAMRFSNKFGYEFDLDETLDLKSVMVPAMIIQPFIENAIWHGITPREDGGKLTVKVDETDHTIRCIIEDDGIGREISRGNKFSSKNPMHTSRGEHLTQARLDMHNLMNERNAKIQIIDNKDQNNKSTGTTVILSFGEE